MQGSVGAFIQWDDGSGPALFIGGSFNAAGSAQSAKGVAKWDGQRWHGLASGIAWDLTDTNYQSVNQFQVFDDGAGPVLYLCGAFRYANGLATASMARWDGQTLSAMPNPFTSNSFPLTMNAMAVHDDGGGPALYVSGVFTAVNNVQSPGAAKWQGGAWHPVGSGAFAPFSALASLASFDDGHGSRLYAVAYSGFEEGETWTRLYRLDGTAWTEVVDGPVSSLGQYPGFEIVAINSGPARGLYACGQISPHRLLRFDGVAWSAVPPGHFGSNARSISALATNPPSLAVGWWEPYAERFERWDGSQWTTIGAHAEPHVHPLGVILDGGIPKLLDYVSDAMGPRLEIRDEVGSVALVEPGLGVPGIVRSFATLDTSAGPREFALTASNFSGWHAAIYEQAASATTLAPRFADVNENNIGRQIATLTPHGESPRLFASGRWHIAVPSQGILPFGLAAFDGAAWEPLGQFTSGLDDEAFVATVLDSGAGPELIVAGRFSQLDGASVQNIARRRAGSWSPLGAGLNNTVRALVVHDDGSGPALYAGGDFTAAGAVQARGLARWDGTSWAPINGFSGSVHHLASAVQEGVPTLVVGGWTLRDNGVYVGRLIRRVSNAWESDIFSYMLSPTGVCVSGAAPMQQVIVANAQRVQYGAANYGNALLHDGVRWTGTGGVLDGPVYSLSVEAGADGATIDLGGSFTTINGVASTNIARLALCALPCPADVNADRLVNMLDLNVLLDQYSSQGQYGFILHADLNADGVVDFLDLNILLSHFGQPC